MGKNTNNDTGTIWLHELNQPDSNFMFSLAQAVFAPGAKLELAQSSGWAVPAYYRRNRLLPGAGQASANRAQGRCHSMPSRRGALTRCGTEEQLCLCDRITDNKRKDHPAERGYRRSVQSRGEIRTKTAVEIVQ